MDSNQKSSSSKFNPVPFIPKEGVLPNLIPFDFINLLQTDQKQFVKEYLKLPPLPYGTTITLDKISCFNYGLPYRLFRLECPDEFPACKNPANDYEDTEQVSPVLFISGNSRYRVKPLLWFPLNDVVTQMAKKQSATQKKLLPTELFIDESDQFMAKLFNLGMSRST